MYVTCYINPNSLKGYRDGYRTHAMTRPDPIYYLEIRVPNKEVEIRSKTEIIIDPSRRPWLVRLDVWLGKLLLRRMIKKTSKLRDYFSSHSYLSNVDDYIEQLDNMINNFEKELKNK